MDAAELWRVLTHQGFWHTLCNCPMGEGAIKNASVVQHQSQQAAHRRACSSSSLLLHLPSHICCSGSFGLSMRPLS